MFSVPIQYQKVPVTDTILVENGNEWRGGHANEQLSIFISMGVMETFISYMDVVQRDHPNRSDRSWETPVLETGEGPRGGVILDICIFSIINM